MATVKLKHPNGNVTIEAREDMAAMYESQGWRRDEGDLKGAALDDALDAAGLSKSGTADEKRARLAEHNQQ